MKSRLIYSAWKTHNQAILENFSDKKVMISYSGGKDSSVVLYLIQKAAEEFNFNYEAHGVFFPANVYSSGDVKKINSYWHKRNVSIIWHKVPVSDGCLAEALKDGKSPCLTCIQMKKKNSPISIKPDGFGLGFDCNSNELFSLGPCECNTRTYIKNHFFR
jgi:tRNA(Ile)-lysidine synthase TilS/MesJ